MVLDNGGSCLGAAITAASLALIDANISTYGIVTAVSAVSVYYFIIIYIIERIKKISCPR